MRIGIDAMGGDFAPLEAVKGAIEAKEQMQDIVPVLFGQKDMILDCFKTLGIPENALEIVHAEEVIDMGEHATKAIAHKKNSSINVAYRYLAEKKIDAFIGAGNTGAMLVGSLQFLKTVDGLDRPCLYTGIPRIDSNPGLLLDVGANADCKPEHLSKFAILGSLLSSMMYKINNPKVGLLNIGEESEKGNLLTKATHQLLAQNNSINFVGNVEGRDIFGDHADVIVCDGFTGNVVIKVCEGFYYRLAKRGVQDEYLDKFNFKHYGGSLVLGVNAPVIVGHGITKAETFVKMVELAVQAVDSQLTLSIQQAMKKFVENQSSVS